MFSAKMGNTKKEETLYLGCLYFPNQNDPSLKGDCMIKQTLCSDHGPEPGALESLSLGSSKCCGKHSVAE